MKKIPLAIGLILISIPLSAQANKTVFGLKSGLNLSIFSASVNSNPSFKPGFHLGIYVKHNVGSNAYFRPELYYSRQGQKDDYQSQPNGPSVGTTTTMLNYLNVPLLFEAGKKFTFQIGPQLGLLLSAREEGTVNNAKVNDDLKEAFTTADLSMVLGLGINANSNLNLGLRLNYGLNDIYKANPYTQV